MPAYARRDIVDEDRLGVYHCIARCVRRAFLCGADPYSGRDYSHRKAWIVDRLRQLAGLFGIEVCDYAVTESPGTTLPNPITPTWPRRPARRAGRGLSQQRGG